IMEVWTLWVPWYWISGGVKVITALASLPTAFFLVQLMPKLMSLPSHEQLRLANAELLQQREILKQSEQRFRQMAENIQEIFWTMNPDTKEVTYVSPAFETICERPLTALYSYPLSYRELIHPEDRHSTLQALENISVTGSLDHEFRILLPDGSVKWLHAIGSA